MGEKSRGRTPLLLSTGAENPSYGTPLIHHSQPPAAAAQVVAGVRCAVICCVDTRRRLCRSALCPIKQQLVGKRQQRRADVRIVSRSAALTDAGDVSR